MIPIERSTTSWFKKLCVPDGKVYRFVNDRIVLEEVSLPMKCSVWKRIFKDQFESQSYSQMKCLVCKV